MSKKHAKEFRAHLQLQADTKAKDELAKLKPQDIARERNVAR